MMRQSKLHPARPLRPPAKIFLAAPNSVEGRVIIESIVTPGLDQVGAQAVRMSNIKPDKLASSILDNINRCDGMIGVMVRCNPHVFWELGVGFALGKPLILLANDEREFGLLADAAHCVLRSDDIGETRIRFDVALRDAMQLAASRTFVVLPAQRPAMP